MTEVIFAEIGKLQTDILKSEQELAQQKEEADIVSKLLRVIADCLDSGKPNVNVMGLRPDHVFISNHKDASVMFRAEPAMMKGGNSFRIPQEIEELMRKKLELENELSNDRKSLEMKQNQAKKLT